MSVPFLALMWGCISAVSLPIGAIIGLLSRPSHKVTSSLMAFGGGALLFALTVELFAHAIHISHERHDVLIIVSTMLGAVVGGLLFELLNQVLNNRGGFLRKHSLLRKHIMRFKHLQARRMARGMSRIRLLQALPAEEMIKLIPRMKSGLFRKGEAVFRQGEEGDRLYFILRGRVEIEREEGGQKKSIAELGDGEVFGEMALLIDEPRTATVRAVSDVRVLVLLRSDFRELLKESPVLQDAARELAGARLQELREKMGYAEAGPEWGETAASQVERLSFPVTETDVAHEVVEHKGGGAALAIWLGIALDGIPESLVIGMLAALAVATGEPMSLAFIVGVFLANLPEAMSSAVTMHRQGARFRRIFWMWMSLCLMTGAGATLGAWMIPVPAQGVMVYFVACIEGLAAGAMLVMIAETMLPEAFEQGGGSVVGLSTLAGFLAALGVKLFA